MKNSQDNEAVIVEDLIRRTAQLVKPSEAAGFIIEPAADSCITLRLLIHIRPDDSEPQVRDAAAIAFETLVRKYVAEDSDGVMLVPNTQKDGEKQYCIVSLVKDRKTMRIVAAIALVALCHDEVDAMTRLKRLQGWP